MPLYFFDTRDNSNVVRDEIGVHLDGFDAARDEATRGLADLARDALPGTVRRELAVEVRDRFDQAVLRAALWFEVDPGGRLGDHVR
jgi:hypothetical protein